MTKLKAVGLGVPGAFVLLKLVLHLLTSHGYGYFRDELYYLACEVARVYRTLAPEEQARASVYAQNYGEAGAIDFFGRRLGLPGAVSGHNNYWLWGPGERAADPLVIVGGDLADHQRAFEEVTAAGRHTCRYCMPYERDLTIWIARRPKAPVAELWLLVKNYN